MILLIIGTYGNRSYTIQTTQPIGTWANGYHRP